MTTSLQEWFPGDLPGSEEQEGPRHDERHRELAEEALLRRWEPLARRLAHRFEESAERDDLEQVARLALWEAAQRYDPARGCQFSTFAVPTIRGALLHYLRDQAPTIRPPRAWWERRPHLKQEADALAQELGRQPTVGELAGRLGMTEEEVAGEMGAADRCAPVSLDEPREGAEGEEAEPLAARIGALDPRLEAVEQRVAVRQAMETLPASLRAVLDGRYHVGLSQREVGRQLGISQMHVSRLERAALDWLRRELREASEGGEAGSVPRSSRSARGRRRSAVPARSRCPGSRADPLAARGPGSP
jgi:RNA polymerase sigma-B factor